MKTIECLNNLIGPRRFDKIASISDGWFLLIYVINYVMQFSILISYCAYKTFNTPIILMAWCIPLTLISLIAREMLEKALARKSDNEFEVRMTAYRTPTTPQ